MRILFNCLFYLFLVIALISFTYLSFQYLNILFELISNKNNQILISNKDNLMLFSSYCILISALLASSAVMKNYTEESSKKISNFYLEKSLIELSNIYNLLKNKNNNRVTWILVSRVILLVDELSNKITEKYHKKVFKLQKFQIQHKIINLLANDSDSGLPISFYAGLEEWKTTKNAEAINEISNSYISNELDPKSILVVYNFIEFPDNYKDPLLKIKLFENMDQLNKWKETSSNKNILSGIYVLEN